MQSISGSAFSRVNQAQEECNYFFSIQAHLSIIMKQHTILTVSKFFEHIKLPFAIQMIIDIIFQAAINCLKENDFRKFFSIYSENPLSLKLSSSLYRLLLQLMEKKLIKHNPEKLSQEMSYSIFCKSELIKFMIPAFSVQSKQISLKTLFQLLNCTNDNRCSIQIMAKFLYRLYGGNFMVSSKENFEQIIKSVIKQVEQYIAHKHNMINRNMKYIKGSKELMKKVDDFIILLSNFKNKQFANNRLLNLSQQIFQGKQFIEKDVFIQKIVGERLKKTSQKDLPLGQYLFIYFQLLLLQMSMLDCGQFQNQVEHRIEVEISNYYVDEMQKIWKKCPYNGNEACNCKKCQCVRRNRQSAKASQQKKRQAVQQVEVMRNRIQELQMKNKQLHQCNTFMKSLLNQLKDHPSFKNLFSRTLEPINKIMDNNQ